MIRNFRDMNDVTYVYFRPMSNIVWHKSGAQQFFFFRFIFLMKLVNSTIFKNITVGNDLQ